MSKPDGGSAFPIITPDMPVRGEPGMSLRDYFASKAMQGMGTWMPDYNPDATKVDAIKSLCNPIMMEARAKWAYAQADAMLKAREV
jgi:hypothetical protein